MRSGGEPDLSIRSLRKTMAFCRILTMFESYTIRGEWTENIWMKKYFMDFYLLWVVSVVFRGIHTPDSEPSRWAVIENKTEDENHMKYWSTYKIVIS